MVDNAGNGAVVLHHLLVVAAALCGGPGLDELAHEDVDLQGLPLVPIRLEELPVFPQEGHVGYILLQFPEGIVKARSILPLLLDEFYLKPLPFRVHKARNIRIIARGFVGGVGVTTGFTFGLRGVAQFFLHGVRLLVCCFELIITSVTLFWL